MQVCTLIIWLAPQAGMMTQITHCDWLPERPRWSYLARSGPGGGGGGGTPYNGLYGEAPPERGLFFRLQVYKRVGISQVEVYKRVGKSVI